MAPTIETLLEPYLRHHLTMGIFVPASAAAVRSDFRGLLRYMQDQRIEPTIDAFSTRVISSYFVAHRQRVSGSTQRRWYKSFTGFGRWAENNDYLPRNPMTKVELGWVPTHHREFMFAGAQEAKRFLTVPVHTGLTPEVDRLLRALLLFGGLRRNEIVKLRWSSVDLEKGEVAIYDSKATRKKNLPNMLDRILPVCPTLREALVAARQVARPQPDDPVVWRQPGRPLAKESFYAAFHSIAKASGMPADAVPHLLRHNLASSLTALGATAADVALLLGHRNSGSDRPTTTDGYVTSSLVRVRSFLDAYCRLVTGEGQAAPVAAGGPAQPVAPWSAAGSGSSQTAPASAGIPGRISPALAADALAMWRALFPGQPPSGPAFQEFVEELQRHGTAGR